MHRVACFLSVILLTACGQSGDLYLPDKPPAVSTPAQPAPAQQPEKKKETP